MLHIQPMRYGRSVRNVPINSLILIVLMVLLLLHGGPVQAASYDTTRMDQFPDFSQTDPQLKLPGGGTHYCVPVATANALVWYAQERGFANLLPVRGVSLTEKVGAVARQLGQKRYMSTAPKGGTSLARFMYGLSAYTKENGYPANISYRGRWQMPKEFGHIDVGAPDIEWIQDKFESGSAVFLSLGYYNKDPRSGGYKRGAGHFVTVVGFGVDKSGAVDRDYVVLHDPGDGSAKVKRRYLKLEPMRRGVFVDRRGNESDASEHLMVTKGMRLRDFSTIVVDAVIALDL